MQSLTKTAILSAKDKDCNEISDRIVIILIQNDFKAMYSL